MIAPLRLAFQALMANKLRSALTMLGNIIGVMCVVALVNIGISGREYIQGSLSSIGQNLVFVFPRYDPDAEDPAAKWRPLEMSDVDAIERDCPSASGVSPYAETGTKIVFGNQHTQTVIKGVWPCYLEMCNWKLAQGTAFTESDVNAGAKICVIGKKVVDQLFGNLDPVGQIVRIDRQPFKVVGTLEAKGAFLTGQDQDNIVFASISVVQDRLTGLRKLGLIYVAAKEREDMEKLKDEIQAALRQSHHLAAGAKSDVETKDLGQIASVVDQVMLAATALLSAIAFISLLVGGIGIMNIMLVSVTERTREIGLRMAVGATDLNILLQFLVEAVVLSAVGGAIGVVLGLGLSAGVSAYFKWPPSLSMISIGVAVVFSAGVGVFFGLYPAWRASRLDPIVALRNE